MLNIKMFGTGQVMYSGRELNGFPVHQSCLLLAYLLLNRNRTYTRDQLAAVFWGDARTTPSSLKHLRNALWRLRSSFGSVGVPAEEYLNVTYDTVAFVRTSNYRLDIELFEDGVSQCTRTAGQALTSIQADELELAIQLYQGDLLEGVDAEWCIYDRERLRLLYLKALSKLMTFHRQHGSYDRGLDYAKRILNCDDTREKVYREMMILHWLAGDRNAALEQYRRCAQVLRDELDVLPMPETQTLYQQMLHNQFRLADQQSLPPVEILPSNRVSQDEPPLMTDSTVQQLRYFEASIEELKGNLHRLESLVHHMLAGSTMA